jgi:hypothetical protein
MADPDPVPDPLGFAIDLGSVRQRLLALKYFLSVTDIQAASAAMTGEIVRTPCAFVSVASETAEPNRFIRGAGGHAQRVTVQLSVLFAEQLARKDAKGVDQVERTRKAVIRQLVAWTPDGAEQPLDYDRYVLRATSDVDVFGECLFRTTYRLNF